MAFHSLENTKPVQSTCPAEGLTITARKVAKRKGGGLTHYIRVQLGKELCRKLCLRLDDVMLDVAFGTGPDAGKLRVQVAMDTGAFPAKRDKQGRYAFSIKEEAADGLFKLDFKQVIFHSCAVRSEPGKTPFIIIQLPDEMLVED